MKNCVFYASAYGGHCVSHLSQVAGYLDGKFDEGSASMMLETKPSKVVSNELTVSWTLAWGCIKGLFFIGHTNVAYVVDFTNNCHCVSHLTGCIWHYSILWVISTYVALQYGFIFRKCIYYDDQKCDCLFHILLLLVIIFTLEKCVSL